MGRCTVVSRTLTCYTEVTENRDIDCVFLRYWSVVSNAYWTFHLGFPYTIMTLSKIIGEN